jgi:hypothetical protein
MPATKPWSSADFDALLARVTPDVQALLADGVPRSRATIVALAERHSTDEVTLTLMRLDVLGLLELQGERYTLPGTKADQQG